MSTTTAAPDGGGGLSSTTAPGKIFVTRAELAEHYKSDWHKYNLKRREAGLALLEEGEFRARWEAALALRKEKESSSAVSGTDHLKNNKKLTKKQQLKQSKKQQKAAANADSASSKGRDATIKDAAGESENHGEESAKPAVHHVPEALAASQENPEIEPLQSLFDAQRSETLEENVLYMQQNFGFFIPDRECLADLEGLLGYCHEKIKLGHYCLYCEKMFPTWQGCQQHMINKQHTKLRYEPGFWEELDPFYDFRREDTSFLADGDKMETDDTPSSNLPVEDDSGEDGWEDMSEDGNDGENEEDLHEGFEREIARFGLDVTPLGELIFPDGRVVGHRALRRYYKQNLRTEESRNTAVTAAQQAAGERIYGGQVININQYNLKSEDVQGAGKGILVPIKNEGVPAGFSTLSLYRYRAAVRKQRRGDEKGKRVREKTFQNMNKMDKKHNRLMNGVSVAHAAR